MLYPRTDTDGVAVVVQGLSHRCFTHGLTQGATSAAGKRLPPAVTVTRAATEPLPAAQKETLPPTSVSFSRELQAALVNRTVLHICT